MKILGIESSCDDTSVALLQADKNGIVVLSESTASQIDIHKKYGGVVPEIAGRAHAEKILPLIEEVIKNHGKPEVIAVTAGPGLMTGLLVGTEAAKSLSYLWDVPLVGVNHIEGHIYSTLIPRRNDEESFGNVRERFQDITSRNQKREISKDLSSLSAPRDELKFPALCLIVSGGHTELVLMRDHGEYELIGKTRDDAAGEAFDKVAKLLGLEYPGGPKISKLAKSGGSAAIKFPRPMLSEDNFDFSFSGLKTAALYWLQEHGGKQGTEYGLQENTLNDFCASFQRAITDVLVIKTIRAAKKHNPKTIILSGGVSANKQLREELQKQSESIGCRLRTPELKYAMDNATMVAVAAYHRATKKQFTPWRELNVNPNWKVYE